ncbi:TonB-dependent receptor [Cesiribacter sp. SM1]|uniref:SusC/RagA family TonB-linked outer membrane protein n=1 Tax=Cesiribacter sp. SM1 TaxID=2861196 RepID=UPI001CD5EDA4|nr:TonB-dependent receptor [Cesiribacter sp. SM1]
MKKLLLFTLLMGWLLPGAIAQQQVTGKVTDALTSEALPGATVLIKGTTTGTVTDMDGNYRLDVPGADAVLVFSYIGYLQEEVQVGSRATVDMALSPDLEQLDEVVVIGYGTQKKQDLTGSIGVVNTETINKVPTNDIRKSMQGQVAGVTVQGGGEPGGSPNVRIRGVGSFGNNDPLYIVDGIQTPISQIPVSDVASVQILKDAAAASIYGSRAANGVVIITTKRGSKGEIKVNYNATHGWQRITNRYDVVGREGYQLLNNEAVNNARLYDPTLTVAPSNDPNSQYFVNDIDTDWQDAGLKTGRLMEHALSFSGGSDNGNYYVSLNYFDHNGPVVGNGPNYDRYSVRVNTDFKLGRFKIGESIQIAKEHFDFSGFLHTGNFVQDLVRAIPTVPVYDPNRLGGYGGPDGVIHRSLMINSIGANSILSNQSDRYRIIGNLYGEIEIVKDLDFRTSLSLERTDWKDTRNEPEFDLGTNRNNNIPKLYDWRGEGMTASIENTLTYEKFLGLHHITALVGNTALQSRVTNLNARADNIDPRFPDVISSGAERFVDAGENENRLESYFGRVLYDFDSKYLLTATIRRDGSSRFGRNYRFGTFPSVSLGWKVSEEEFMKGISWLNQLKLRGSYGILGNQEIGNYGHTTYINPYAHAVFGGQLALGATQSGFANEDLRWEETKSTNVGIDLAVFENRLTFTTEYYRTETDGVLVQVPLPPSTGVYDEDAPFRNAGILENSGFEFILGYNKVEGEFTYNASVNLTTLNNKVVSLGGGVPIFGNTSITEEGGEVSAFYGYKIEKIIQTQEELDALNSGAPDGVYQEVNTGRGDFKFMDLDGDGQVTEEDRTYLGSAIPKYTFGGSFSAAYKNFDFSMLLQGNAGNKVLDAVRASIEAAAGYTNYSTNTLNRWTPDNTDTDVPRVILSDPNGNGRASDRWLENGSFLRLNSVQLGYTLPTNIMSKYISSLRFYVTGQNLVTFTKFQGMDPDFRSTGIFSSGVAMPDEPNRAFNAFSGGLPNPKGLMLGLQVQF